MKSKIIGIIIIIALIAGIATVVIKQKNKDYSNPEGAIGNTPCNILNGGKFLELDGVIYFANPNDAFHLWRMDPNGKNAKLISTDTVYSINGYGQYLYYAMTNNNWRGGKDYGITRISIKGTDKANLVDFYVTTIALSHNNLYFLGTNDNKLNHLYTYDIKSKKVTQLSDKAISPAGLMGDYIYYSNLAGNHSVFRYNISSDNDVQFFEANSFKATDDGSNIYFIDLDDNYSLVKVSHATGTKEYIYKSESGNKCISYNYTDKYFYYFVQSESGAKLYRCDKNGSFPVEIMEGLFDGIYCTTKYTYITMYNDKNIYKIDNSAANPTAELLTIR